MRNNITQTSIVCRKPLICTFLFCLDEALYLWIKDILKEIFVKFTMSITSDVIVASRFGIWIEILDWDDRVLDWDGLELRYIIIQLLQQSQKTNAFRLFLGLLFLLFFFAQVFLATFVIRISFALTWCHASISLFIKMTIIYVLPVYTFLIRHRVPEQNFRTCNFSWEASGLRVSYTRFCQVGKQYYQLVAKQRCVNLFV